MRFLDCRNFLLPATLVLWLGACSTPAPKPAPRATPYVVQDAAAPPAAPASAGTARPTNGIYAWSPAMDDTSQRLQGALRGSDVALSQTTDQRLWLSLPIDAAFAKGRSAVKPGAAASLDQVALVLRSNARAQVQIVGDPDTLAAGAGGSALALDRAASARDWIVARGIVASRIMVASRTARTGPPADAPRLDILIGERAGAAAR